MVAPRVGVFLLLIAWQAVRAEDCSVVKIKGPHISGQTGRIDYKYQKGDLTEGGKPVYKRTTGSPDYMYYKYSTSRWNVGTNVGSAINEFYVTDNASHPVDVTNTWYAKTKGLHQPYTSIYLECTSILDDWHIALIALGAAIVLIIIIALIVRCVNKCKDKNLVRSIGHSDATDSDWNGRTLGIRQSGDNFAIPKYNLPTYEEATAPRREPPSYTMAPLNPTAPPLSRAASVTSVASTGSQVSELGAAPPLPPTYRQRQMSITATRTSQQHPNAPAPPSYHEPIAE